MNRHSPTTPVLESPAQVAGRMLIFEELKSHQQRRWGWGGEAPIYNLHGCSPTSLGLTQTDGNGERDVVVVEASTAIDYIMRERHYKNSFLELLGAQVCVDLCFRM